MENIASYGRSKRGKKTLIYKGFEFWHCREKLNVTIYLLLIL